MQKGNLRTVLLIASLLLVGAILWVVKQTWEHVDRLSAEQVNPSASEITLPADSLLPSADWAPQVFSGEISIDQFKTPERKFGPWIKWWWPKHTVSPYKLIPQLQAFYERGFAGVNIEITQAGISPEDRSRVSARRLMADSPEMLQRLELLDRELAKRDMQFDWTPPFGWPAGQATPSTTGQMRSLMFGEAHVRGGKRIKMTLPLPETSFGEQLVTSWEKTYFPHENFVLNLAKDAKIIWIYAFQSGKHQRTHVPWDLADQISRDTAEVYSLMSFVKENKLDWVAPEGYWEIIVAYETPAGQQGSFSALDQPVFLADPLDSTANANWSYYSLGNLTIDSLKSMRGLSTGAYVWFTDLIYHPQLIPLFEQKYGYSLLEVLPALAKPGVDHAVLNMLSPVRQSSYDWTDFDERILDDYLRLRSAYFIQNGISLRQESANVRGVTLRAHPYGGQFDNIQAATRVQLPATTDALGADNSLFLKQTVSGAWLGGNPIVGADVLLERGLSGTLTPKSLRNRAHALFSNGINQISWQGAVYDPNKANSLSPWLSAHFPLDFRGESFREADNIWKYMAELNTYVSRCQYLLQQGQPEVDVLVYYPFLGYPFEDSSWHFLQQQTGLDWSETTGDERTRWLKSIKPYLSLLESRGYSWAWVTDPLLDELTIQGNSLQLGQETFDMLLAADLPQISLASLDKLVELKRGGADVMLMGDPPRGNVQTLDSLVDRLGRELLSPLQPKTSEDLANILTASGAVQDVSFSASYPFLRRLTRRLVGNEEITFIWNQSEQDRYFELDVQSDGVRYYWLNPETAQVYAPFKTHENGIRGYLPAGKALFLWQQNATAPFIGTDTLAYPLSSPLTSQLVNQRQLTEWDFSLATFTDTTLFLIEDTTLFDWQFHPVLQQENREGIYVHTFEIGVPAPEKRYLLDLGEVEGVPFIRMNARAIDTLIFPPFRLDVTNFLLPGTNILEVWLTPPSRNAAISKSKSGELPYSPFQDMPKIPTGLLGPVYLHELQE